MPLRATSTQLLLTCLVGLTACEHRAVPSADAETEDAAAQASDDACTDCVAQVQEQLVCDDSIKPGAAPPRLMTRSEYNNTVQALLGTSLTPADVFPPENKVVRFENDAEAHRATLLLTDQHTRAAEALAKDAVARLDELLPCDLEDADDACALTYLEDVAERAYRRPLDQSEAQVFDDLYAEASEAFGLEGGIQTTLAAMLQSPQFLYRFDAQREAAPERAAELRVSPDARWLEPHALASRLSYFLWNSAPDRELLDAATSGALLDADEYRTQVVRLLVDGHARTSIRNFHRQWLGLDTFSKVSRELSTGQDPTLYNASWNESVLRYVDDVYTSAGSTLNDLFSRETVFLNEQLSGLYGVGVDPSLMDTQGFVATTLNSRGLLAQPGLMAMLAYAAQSSPIRRGVFVRTEIMCQPLPPPPPSVDNTPPDPDPFASTRERFEQHRERADCAACHSQIDGIGFAFERYDQLGRYREIDGPSEVDDSGEIVGAADPALNGTIQGIDDLSSKLAGSDQVQDCVATQWFRYAMGRIEGQPDECNVDAIQRSFENSGGRFSDLLIAIATSDAFLYRQLDTEELAAIEAMTEATEAVVEPDDPSATPGDEATATSTDAVAEDMQEMTP